MGAYFVKKGYPPHLRALLAKTGLFLLFLGYSATPRDSGLANKSFTYFLMDSTIVLSNVIIPAPSNPPPVEPLKRFIEEKIAIFWSITIKLEWIALI